MKLKLPTQLILLTLVTGFAIAGWIFVDSCKHRVMMDLETFLGDPSCLADKKLGILFESVTDSDKPTSNILVSFPDGPVTENITIEAVKPVASPSKYYYCESISNDLLFGWDLLGLPHPEFPDDTLETDTTESIRFDLKITPIEIDDVLYFTFPSVYLEWNYCGVMGNNDRTANPVKYTMQSGIWAIDETSELRIESGIVVDPIPENVVPFSISGPSGISEVYGIYATEDESAVVLITVENKVDLYATFYDITTKTARAPILIFHSDSGRLIPYILEPNATCPMGSILLDVRGNVGSETGAFYALALRVNEVTGLIDTEKFSIIQPNWSPTLLDNLHAYIGREYVYYDIHDSPSILYDDDELWIISYQHDKLSSEDTYEGSIHILQNSPPDPLNELYHGQLIQEFLIQGYRDNAMFYEGVLSVDLTVANPELRIKDFSKSDYGDNYRPEWNDVITRVNFIIE
jgi:hypothetical protein